MMQYPQWEGFAPGEWQRSIDVRRLYPEKFYTVRGRRKVSCARHSPHEGRVEKMRGTFAAGAGKRRAGRGDEAVFRIDNFEPGYIDRDNEVIVGLQTDAPLKRIVNPYGGMRCAKASLEQYGYALDEEMEHTFSEYPQNAQRGRVRCIPGARARRAPCGPADGPADAMAAGASLAITAAWPCTASMHWRRRNAAIWTRWTAP